ncbi:hypothetical protein Srot_0660 [Segniliparus rotundus DSM 44985]|uniref:Secreted protein n=1 Tax=Segniliparus rotundus (strain ATCC BAA-972 / CDC 1076 / CIP 108378 / DSM 44985 / JCM 13578) TaxID=640132 RepID=D6ZD78_SEGRD|nr:hypothetical protein [Segniliparus rotundus]ADG97142.1 hypothetical protein Srot_0660 [Segniliparus rotundus DSM 44985]
MRPTVAAVLCSAVCAASVSFIGQAEAEQDFHPIWCPQATSYYVQLREALDPLRAATVAHDLDVAKERGQSAQAGQGSAPGPNASPPVKQRDNEDQPPRAADGNPLWPRHASPPAPPRPADQAAQPPSAPAGPAPVKQWAWGDPDVQDAVDQFEEKSPLLYRRINTLVAETWWAELQDAGSALSAKFGEVVGDVREQVAAQDLTRDWISLEEQYDVIKNLCVGWGETAQPGVAPPGQPEWPAGSSPDTARPPGIENTAWPHTPGWVDVAVPDPDDPDAPPPAHRPYPPPADAQPAPLAHQGCERYDYRSGGWGQYPFCPGEGPDGDNPGPDEADGPGGSGE